MKIPTNPPRRLAIAALLAALLLPLASVHGPLRAEPTRADEGEKVTLFTAIAESGDEESIPEKLKPYRDQLIRVAKRFRLAASKQETVKPGAKTKIALPEKLGEAQLAGDGKAMTLEIVQEGKVIATIKVNKFPMIVSDAKLKVGGQQVVIILDKGHK